MKKFFAWLLCAALLLCGACAEGNDTVFPMLSGMDWTFTSGAGAWSTDLWIGEDGTFSGEYHDSEMGESAETYPNGTVYFCSFTGRLSVTAQPDDGPWKLRVEELRAEEGAAEETIDGIRYVRATPYGLSAGDEMLLYRPGTPVSALPEDMLVWAHVTADSTDRLDSWFLCSEANASGFVGEAPEPVASLANPWEELTAEALRELSGVAFNVPEDAENVVYRYLRSVNLAEMQFFLEGDEFCMRVRPGAERGEEISGMYFAWENEEEVQVHDCTGIIGMAKCGTVDWVERCLWYDAARERMCSLSVSTIDPDGLDLAAVAEMVYPAVQ